MAGNDDMTHYMKHLYLAFTEQVLNVFSLIVSVLEVLPLIGQCGNVHSNTHSRRHQGVGLGDTPGLTLCFLF